VTWEISPTGDAPRACILSMTPVNDEPRVNRQAHALHEDGFEITVAGYLGRSPKPRYWTLIELEPVRTSEWGSPRVRDLCCHLSVAAAVAYYARQPGAHYVNSRLGAVHCDLVVANDYFTILPAAWLAERCDAPFVVDCHEYATEQYSLMDDWRKRLHWTLFDRPLIRGLQRAYLPRAAAVSTVCEGIAALLQRDYGLSEMPAVVRSMPAYSSQPYRPCGERIRVLYHGLLSPTRGLESAIASVASWRPEFELVIRGPGPAGYVAALREQVRRHGVEQRVSIEDPVLYTEMIPQANRADVGYVVLENYSPQRTFSLPNKFFEYIMAGLALCVSALPEMARIVRAHDLGVLVPSTDPAQIAAAINSLSRERIEACKRQSLEVAKELCWERESERMLRAYGPAVEERRSRKRSS